VDPLAGLFPGHSPYNYVLNSPLSLVDPDGRAPCCVVTVEVQARFAGGAYSTTVTVGLAFDFHGNAAAFASGGGGVGPALLLQGAFVVGVYPMISDVSQLEGFGMNIVGVLGVGSLKGG